MQDNVLTRRRTLGSLIDDGCIDESVLAELLPGGVPIPDEDLLWDYKQSLPVMPTNPGKLEKDEYAAKMAEVAKDAVAFGLFGRALALRSFGHDGRIHPECLDQHRVELSWRAESADGGDIFTLRSGGG